MDQFIGHAVPLNVGINRVPVVLIVAEGIEYLCEGHMRQPTDNFLRSYTEFPQLSDCAYRCSSAADDGGTLKNVRCANNVRVMGRRYHQMDLLIVRVEMSVTEHRWVVNESEGMS
jgi:hypothetical protein